MEHETNDQRGIVIPKDLMEKIVQILQSLPYIQVAPVMTEIGKVILEQKNEKSS